MDRVTHLISLINKEKTACGLNASTVKISSINLTDCTDCLRIELKEIKSDENEIATKKWRE